MRERDIVEIRCLECKKWFNAPFQTDIKSFMSSELIGNTTACPHCGKATYCNTENVRIRSKNGGFIGDETI